MGGGGAAASKNISHLPWAVGDNSGSGGGTDFVTVFAPAVLAGGGNLSGQIRLLAAGEYDTNTAEPLAAANNMNYTNTTSTNWDGNAGLGATFNSIKLSTNAVLNFSNGPTVASGACLMLNGSTISNTGGSASWSSTSGDGKFFVPTTATVTQGLSWMKSGQVTIIVVGGGGTYAWNSAMSDTTATTYIGCNSCTSSSALSTDKANPVVTESGKLTLSSATTAVNTITVLGTLDFTGCTTALNVRTGLSPDGRLHERRDNRHWGGQNNDKTVTANAHPNGSTVTANTFNISTNQIFNVAQWGGTVVDLSINVSSNTGFGSQSFMKSTGMRILALNEQRNDLRRLSDD